MSNANKPAFPSEPRSFAPPDSFGSGLSKREYFAAMALQEIIADTDAVGAAFRALSPEDAFARVAESSVRYADALLVALAKEQS